jgi:hypothetical protein
VTGDLRAALIQTMDAVRDEQRPGVVYWLIPQFADAIIELLPRWAIEEPKDLT